MDDVPTLPPATEVPAVRVVDIDIRFGTLVMLLVKVALAVIPALVILSVIGLVIAHDAVPVIPPGGHRELPHRLTASDTICARRAVSPAMARSTSSRTRASSAAPAPSPVAGK